MPEAYTSIERRGNPRVSIKVPVKYRWIIGGENIKNVEEWRATEQNAYTLDMSLGGMFIAVEQPLKVGNIFKFDIFLLDMKDVVALYGEVVRVDNKGAGLQFLMMSNDSREALQIFLLKAAAS